MGWVKKYDYVFELINVLLSRDIESLLFTQININVFVNEAHVATCGTRGGVWWGHEIGHS